MRIHRILVVDENPCTRRDSVATLRSLECTVATATGASSALAKLRRVKFDAVLLSASLPDVPASTFVERLHQDEALSMVPVVVAAVTPRAAIDTIRVGARACIRKPVDAGGLISALPLLLNRRTRTVPPYRSAAKTHSQATGTSPTSASTRPRPPHARSAASR
jgi:DNA-binding NtrC family response regulator